MTNLWHLSCNLVLHSTTTAGSCWKISLIQLSVYITQYICTWLLTWRGFNHNRNRNRKLFHFLLETRRRCFLYLWLSAHLLLDCSHGDESPPNLSKYSKQVFSKADQTLCPNLPKTVTATVTKTMKVSTLAAVGIFQEMQTTFMVVQVSTRAQGKSPWFT